MDILGKAFGGLEVTLLTLGFLALLGAVGLAKEVSLGKTPIKSPTGRAARGAWALAGLILIASAFLVAEPRWVPTVTVERVWNSTSDKRAVQIRADGDELYVLSRNGNVWRSSRRGEEVLVDSGTASEQIETAGGILYVMKTNGNIWSGILASPHPEQGATFTPIDPGEATRSMVASGETLYLVKKQTGKLWRRSLTRDESSESWSSEWTEIKTERPVTEIATSGTVLYYLTPEGAIRAAFPLPEAHSTSLEADLNAALEGCGRASKIAVSGRKVYLTDDRGNAWVCFDGRRESLFQACQEESVLDLDVAGGIVYLLTSTDQIVRVAPKQKAWRFPRVSEGNISLTNLVATGQGVYAIDSNGTVWRFSESLRKQV